MVKSIPPIQIVLVGEFDARDYFLWGWSLDCNRKVLPMQTYSGDGRWVQIARHRPPSSHGYQSSLHYYANGITCSPTPSFGLLTRYFAVQLLSSIRL